MKLLGFSLCGTADGNRLFPSTLDSLTPPFRMQHPVSPGHVLIDRLGQNKKKTNIVIPKSPITYFHQHILDIRDNKMVLENCSQTTDDICSLLWRLKSMNELTESLSKIILLSWREMKKEKRVNGKQSFH